MTPTTSQRRSGAAQALARLDVLVVSLALIGSLVALGPAQAFAAHGAHAARCPHKHKGHLRHGARCQAGKRNHRQGNQTPTSGKAPFSKPTVTPSPANLTPVELEVLETLNEDRAEHGLGALSTSAPLQAISEQRAQEMAEQLSDYAGHDLSVELGNAGLCTTGQSELSGTSDQTEATADEEEELQKALEVPLEARWTVVGVAVLEAGGVYYVVEDFAAPC
jgi:uncharacterized protein YkwD